MSSTKFRFVIVGGINTLIGLSTFPLIFWFLAPLNLHYLIILLISQFLCINFSFFMNKWFVFRSHGDYLNEYLKFILFHISHIILNFVFLPILVELFAIQPIIAQFIFSILVIASSYVWYSKITFLRKP